ncbi:MAG: CotH kinase family protein [Verrucomicrobiales bacterium]|nr:CotH kinase family protein [Verrucomicrobiales bacterium]
MKPGVQLLRIIFLAWPVWGILLHADAAEETAPPGSGFIEVAHLPLQPKSGEPVTVTARAGENGAIRSLTLRLQVVEPGQYIRKTDPAYDSSWRDLPMSDDGQNGDARAADGIFTAVVSAEIQKHRRLVRYTMALASPNGTTKRLPQAPNACPNYAWFVYDGVPAWTGASKPGTTAALTFPPSFLATLPTYHLIARASDVERSQWDSDSYRKPFLGTLIYEGRVYDHIQFHNRGQASTYLAGKNKWGFKFNPSQEFQARDLWGRKYRYPWAGFSLNACASPWAQVNRGMAGMDEAVSFRAYQLAGVPSPNVHWIHFRVIDAAEETSTKSQYAGDLWGLYLVLQEKNGTWLRERGLPDGNIHSPETGPKHMAKGLPADGSDWQQFSAASARRQSEAWWRANFDLPAYYSFHAINRVVSNVDLRHGANHYMYHRPDGHWVVLPHDLDMMFIAKTHWPGIIDQTRCLSIPSLRLEYQNRAREILDLFCADATPNGGQIGQLVAEYSRMLCPSDQERTWPELDMAMWNYHPRSNAKGQFYIGRYNDGRMGGAWRRTLATPDFAGFCKYITEFCTDSRPVKNYKPNDGDQRGYGFGFLWSEAQDDKMPARPTIRYVGSPGFPSEHLSFETSPFASPGAGSFTGVQWRVGAISAPGLAGYRPDEPFRYEIEPHWTSAELTTSETPLRLPPNICQTGQTYRVRARYKDSTGRWSHWSEPVQFVPTVRLD